jgi:hypothetical protein
MIVLTRKAREALGTQYIFHNYRFPEGSIEWNRAIRQQIDYTGTQLYLRPREIPFRGSSHLRIPRLGRPK